MTIVLFFLRLIHVVTWYDLYFSRKATKGSAWPDVFADKNQHHPTAVAVITAVTGCWGYGSQCRGVFLRIMRAINSSFLERSQLHRSQPRWRCGEDERWVCSTSAFPAQTVLHREGRQLRAGTDAPSTENFLLVQLRLKAKIPVMGKGNVAQRFGKRRKWSELQSTEGLGGGT